MCERDVEKKAPLSSSLPFLLRPGERKARPLASAELLMTVMGERH